MTVTLSAAMDNLIIERIDDSLPLPSYATQGSAGIDLYSCVSITIPCHNFVLIPTGIRIQLPDYHEAQIRPRSGLALKHGITVLNSPGTIDTDYRGEIKVLLMNHGKNDFNVERGMRIAQMVISKYERPTIIESSVDQTARNSSGFGSTGY